MPSRLLLDEHMHVKVGHLLSAKGHDVLLARSLSEDKRGDGIGDEFVLQEAVKQKRAVVTFNWTDFVRLHQERRGHYGILVCRKLLDERRGPDEELAKLLDRFLRSAGSLKGQLYVMRKSAAGVAFVAWTAEEAEPQGGAKRGGGAPANPRSAS